MEIEEHREANNSVMCLLTDPEGTPLGAPMYLPQSAGPQQLSQIVNKLLSNVRFISCLIVDLFFFFLVCWSAML